MKKILFVCTGNTCRSPMATAIFNYFAGLEPAEFDYEATSAGLAVSGDTPASENAILAMKDFAGIDITKHHTHIINQDDVKKAFLVLTMALSHKRYILSLFSDTYHKVYTLKEYAYNISEQNNRGSNNIHTASLDIADPYGSSLWSYKLCAQELVQAIEKLVEKLKKIEVG